MNIEMYVSYTLFCHENGSSRLLRILVLFLVGYLTMMLVFRPHSFDDRMNNECGAVGGTRIGRGNRNTRRKPALMPVCPPQILNVVTWART
jgi:hypothetical protein